MIGQTLSHYRIVEKLGAGGMGEVYIAEDTKLSRKVALKVLPPEMADNAERRARFGREAKAVAALDHPNIVTIYSVEEAEGVHFYTMQLVKGKTLTELIPKKGLPLNNFFEIAIPLADSVSAAHEQGIIHRDLKPDNLMVSDDGRLKILDFGLAKLKPGFAEEGASELPTQSATAEGRILGTVAYMSPEQAEGKTVDNRSDIFSIGIILYEMATGERPFKGDTAASVMSSILKDTPQSPQEVNPDLPRDLGRIIRRCLVKDTDHRYQTAKDLRNELEELKQDVDSGEVLEGVSAAAAKPKSKWLRHIALVIAIVVAGIVGYQMRLGEVTEDTAELPIQGTFTQLTAQPGQELFPSLSPDGRFVVYASPASGNWDIYLKRVGGERLINLTEDSGADDTQPAYRPDGEQIAFRSERDGGGIFLMGATGESVRRLTDFGYKPAWSFDGKKIVFATANRADPTGGEIISQIWTANVTNGETQLITEGDAVQPSWSPGGARIAYWGIDVENGHRDIWTVPVDGGEALQVTEDAFADWSPAWSPDGEHLYFSSDRGGSVNLWRIPINETSGEILAPPQPVTSGASASRIDASLSRDGKQIVFVEAVRSRNLWKAPFDPVSGTVRGELTPITEGSRLISRPDPSPDGNWLAYVFSEKKEDIFIMGTDGTISRQLTDDFAHDRAPAWSPDGKRIAFYSTRSGSYEIWTIHPDGSGLNQLTVTPGQITTHFAWSPDGLQMAYTDFDTGTIYTFNLDRPWEEQAPQRLPPLDDGQVKLNAHAWSPDGQWLAAFIRSAEKGFEGGIVVFSLKSQKYQRLTDFGGFPVWLRDSRRLLFRHERGIHLVDRDSRKVHEVLSIPPDEIYNLSVSHDNRWIYFTRNVNEADIWMLTLNEERE